MADNHLSIYQKNTKTIAVLVKGLNDLSPYVPYLSVKVKSTDTSTVLFKAGVVTDPSTTLAFTLTSIDTSLNAMDYTYDITLVGNSQVMTIVRDRFSINDNVYV